MSLAGDLQNLKEQQRRELAALRARMTTIADVLEHDASPAQWIGGHPYVATAGAALIGFVAAQLPGKSATPARASRPAPPPAAPPAPAPAPSTRYADLLALAADLAGRFLQPEAPPATLARGDGGAIAGPDFPRSFRCPAEGPAAKPR